MSKVRVSAGLVLHRALRENLQAFPSFCGLGWGLKELEGCAGFHWLVDKSFQSLPSDSNGVSS